MEENKITKKIVFSVIAVVLLIVAVVGATYAYFSATAGTDTQTVTTGTLTMGFTDGEILRATGITPIADSEIKTKATELPFSVTNTGNQHMKLTISLTDITISEELKDIDFRWGLYNADTGNGLSFGIFKDLGTETSMVIYRDTIIDAADPDITKNYILRVWIHDNGALQNYMQGKSFSAKVTVDGEAIEYTPEECFTFNSETGQIENGGLDEVIGNALPGYKDTCPKDVVIPKTINGVSVKTIGSSSFIDSNIQSVIIPDTVTFIDENSFSGNNLIHVTIPESITKINDGSFSFNEMNTLFLPDTTTLLGTGVFSNNNFTHLTISASASGEEVYIKNKNLSSVVLMEGIDYLGFGMFSNCDNLTSVEIPRSVTVIAPYAFKDCSNLTKIVVRGKTSLADFDDFEGLTTEGGLPEGVTIEFRP